MSVVIETNKYQTPITDELLASLHTEVRDELLDLIQNVPFINNLISPKRKRARDCERDSKGRIIVDLANPHILEDMDYFRPAALHYKEHGCYSRLRPSGNPNSEWAKWVKEELRRCWEGYVRPSDGEWVTGTMYWYLNYSPIMLVENTGGNRNKRIFSFPEVWESAYYRFHYKEQAKYGGKYAPNGNLNAAEIASRGKGKSYSLAAIMSRNFIIGPNTDERYNTNSVAIASKKEYLVGNALLNKFVEMIDFLAENTEFPKIRIKDSINDMQWRMGYKDMDLGIERGTKNMVLGVTTSDNISKVRGKRATDIVIDEIGSFPKLLNMYNTLIDCVYDGDLMFGQMFLTGTSGEEGSEFESIKNMMYAPEGNKIYPIPNVYDRNAPKGQNFILFTPAFLNLNPFHNKDGVSDVVAALVKILSDRVTTKYSARERATLLRRIAERPIVPLETIVRTDLSFFPVADLTDRYAEISANSHYYDDILSGTLTLDGGVPVFTAKKDPLPLREFPHTTNRQVGAIEIYELPKKNPDGKIPFGRYIAGVDPIDDDVALESVSLFSMFVLDIYTDKIVCEWTGRYDSADECFERCRRICMFYNAELLYENNKKGLYAYFAKTNSLMYLADCPPHLRDMEMIKTLGVGNKSKGVNATHAVNDYARRLIKEWLLTTHKHIKQDSDGNEQEIEVSNISRIQGVALLQELIKWNAYGNFDRVSALGMLMILRAEKYILFNGNPQENQIKRVSLRDDKFFQKLNL